MENTFKTFSFLILMLLSACNSDDNNSPEPDTPISEFKIDGGSSYITPNGYLEEYPLGYFADYSSDGEIGWFALRFIDGEYMSITDPENRPCPYVENLNHGVSIWLRLNPNDKLIPGKYQYTTNDSSIGIMSNSEVFYDYKSIDNCLGISNVRLKITSGELTVSKENDSYNIKYSLVDDDGKKIEGSYFGKLQERIIPEW